MRRVMWLLRWRASQLALGLGIVLVAAALTFSWFAVKPLEQTVDALERARSQEPQGQLSRIEDDMARQGTPRAQLASFYGYFARAGNITELLGKLYDVAKANGVEMQRAEYRMSSVANRKLNRYQVIVPIQGNYRTIRVFISNALRELPTMSLDHVQFQRKAVGDEAVDAQLSFSFHLAK